MIDEKTDQYVEILQIFGEFSICTYTQTYSLTHADRELEKERNTWEN